MSDQQLVRLLNPPFALDFRGQTYQVKKASLAKVVLYNERVRQLSEKGAKNVDPELAGYALYLVLKEAVPDLTEEQVMEEVPGDIEVYDTMVALGFVNPSKAKALLKMIMEAKKETAKYPITESSLLPSQTEQDGAPIKSEA